jgi:hypothetical protein
LDRINPISPSNPKKRSFFKAALDFLKSL